jgi:hypothetical protein
VTSISLGVSPGATDSTRPDRISKATCGLVRPPGKYSSPVFPGMLLPLLRLPGPRAVTPVLCQLIPGGVSERITAG